MNQVEPASPMIFNILVDKVVRTVLKEVCSLQEAHHGMVWEAVARNLVLTRMMEGSRVGITSRCKTP